MRPQSSRAPFAVLAVALAELLAAPVSAQDAFEPDNTFGTASGILDGQIQTHSIDPVGDEDWVTFTLAAEAGLRVETAGPAGDTRMWLRDAGVREIEFDDDGGAGLFSRITRDCAVNPLPPGVYYVQVDEFGGNDKIASYDLFLDILACPDLFEPDDSSGAASPIRIGEPQTHSITPVGESDWMTFRLPVSAAVELETTGPSGDTRMSLRDAALSTVEFNDDGGAGLFSLIDRQCGVDALPAGTYFVEIDEFGDNHEILRYDIELRVPELCTPFAYAAGVWSDDTVRLLDTSLASLGGFPAGSDRPNGIAVGNGLIFSGHFSTEEVVAYDLIGAERFRWGGALSGLQGMAFVDGSLAIARLDQIEFHNPLTGALIRTLPAPCGGVEGLAYDGSLLWLLCDTLEAINPQTGAAVRSIPNPATACSFDGTGLASSAPGTLAAVCDDGSWWVISSADGGVIVSGDNGLAMYGLKGVTFTPEPGATGLGLVAAACLVALARLRRRA